MAVNDYGIEIQKEPEMVMVPIADYEAEKMRLQELESENKKLEDYIDAYQKSEALNIEKLDKKDERIKELLATISKMETTTPKWISVKERLPEFGVNVLINDGKYCNVMWRVECEKNGYYWEDGECGAHKDMITHWMPLPEPPTTEEFKNEIQTY